MKQIIFMIFMVSVFSRASVALAMEPTSTTQQQQIAPPTTPLDLTVSPITISLETNPGASVSSEIKVHNNGSTVEYLKITLGTFKADSTGERPAMRDLGANDEFASWIHVSQDTFIVNAGEWKTIPFVFSPPNSAAFSYYYTLVVSRQSNPTGQGSGSVVVSGSPAVLVLATVRSPNAKRELQFSAFKTASFISEFLPTHFTVAMKNTGNVHIVPTGDIFIDGMGKKNIAIIPINPTASSILPQSERSYKPDWDDGFPVYKNDHQLSWDFSHADRLRFGKYTAHMILVYDNGERDVPIEASVSFWVIPWRILGIGLLVLSLSLLGLRSIIRPIAVKLQSIRQTHI